MKTKLNSSMSSETLETIKLRFVTSPIHNFLPLEVEGFNEPAVHIARAEMDVPVAV